MSAPLNHTMLALTFEQYPDGYETEKVPRHITVLPWFTGDEHNTTQIISEACGQTGPIEVLPGKLGQVGSEGYWKAARFLESSALRLFHKRLFSELVKEGIAFSHPQWLGDNYAPHIRVKPGDSDFYPEGYTFSSLAMVRNGRGIIDGAARKTITNIPLGNR